MNIDKCYYLIKLMRLNRPIGLFLLLWPTLWALWLSSSGVPNISVLIIFVLGVVFMRSAGCVINDYIDKDFDKDVKRTKCRPLVKNLINSNDAIILFVFLVFLSFCLLIFILNFLIFFFSVFGLCLTCIYPYIKRYSYFPQVILGILFSLSIPMVFIVICKSLDQVCVLLFFANFFWTIAYDTQYAMLDKDDDILIGIKSTAVFFGKFSKTLIILLQFLVLVLFIILGIYMRFVFEFYIVLFFVFIIFFYQFKLIYEDVKDKCFRAFLLNNYAEMLVFIGIFLEFF